MEKQEQPVTETATPQQTPEKKGNKKAVVACSLIALVLIVGGAVAWFFYTAHKNAENELTAYEILENNYNMADYEDFLARYPQSERAAEVSERLTRLKSMAAAWESINLSGSKNDFVGFKNRFRDAHYDQLCDLKLDSLDWVEANHAGTEEAFQLYLRLHPDGRYAADASIAASNIQGSRADEEERLQIAAALSGFFSAFGHNDEMAYCTFIAPVMKQFLQKKDATKADVVQIIGGMFNEHISDCKFTLNNDYEITKQQSETGQYVYRVAFSVDQHIERDNEGKTFGSYTAVAELNAQFKITALTLKEVSRQ